MKRLLPVLFLAVGCSTSQIQQEARTATLSGTVLERRANTKTYESWNSPGDPYYVLDTGEVTEKYRDGTNTWQETRRQVVTLRPSDTVTMADMRNLLNKQVMATGHFTEGKPYVPTNHAEQYPMEPEIITKPDATLKLGKMRPAKHGRGFVVEQITEENK